MIESYRFLHSPKPLRSIKDIIAKVLDITASEIRFRSICKGSFNDILRFQAGKEEYALRIRSRDSDFGFEKIIKEPFAVLVLNNHDLSDRELGIAIQKLYQQQYCGLTENSLVGKFYYSDWSKTFDALPYAFSIYQWKQGELLYSAPTSEHFEAAGGLLARLHQRRFLSCYSSILEIGSKPLSLHDSILSTCTTQYEAALSKGGSKALLDELILWVRTRSNDLPATYRAVFCHYDFSGSNLIVDKDNAGIFALDFDNWKVSICEEDFPKLLHWTIVDPITHKRRSSPKRVDDFMKGYRNGGGLIDDYLLRLKEAEWLLRVYSHSLHRELTNPEEYQQSSFPGSHDYEQAISVLLQATS